MWSSRCSELQYKEVASLKIREDQCVHVLCYVNGCFEQHHKLLDVQQTPGIALSISDVLHQSVQLFLSVSEGSFQCCKLEILFERNHVFKKIKTTPKSGPDLRLFFPFFAFHPCHYSSLHLGTVLQIFELGVFHLLIQMMYGLYSAFAFESCLLYPHTYTKT